MMTLKELVETYDKSNMLSAVLSFPEQIKSAKTIAYSASLNLKSKSFNKIVLLGMGGSAIAGDILRTTFFYYPLESGCEIIINRNYNITTIIDDKTLVIASSYSGNTEETLSAINQAIAQTQNIICITCGGELEKIAQKHELEVIKLPSGFQPRAALGYSLFTLIHIINRLGILPQEISTNLDEEINEILTNLEESSQLIEELDEEDTAYELAESLKDMIAVIYSSDEILGGVNLRFKAQIQENADNLTFSNILPEMNHNEINAWQKPEDVLEKCLVLFLVDSTISEQMLKRVNATIEYLSTQTDIIIIEGKGDTVFQRNIDLIFFADKVSYYLALLNQSDPTTINAINYLKQRLS
jgi:glucose/mannose-6-phosphate isomerase